MADKPKREDILPLDEGLQPGRRMAADPVATADAWSQQATLAALSEQYTFFTHGLFFTHGGMTHGLHDPVQDFVNTYKRPIQPLILDLDRAIFAHMGNSTSQAVWNHRLIGVENDVWPELQAALAGVATVDRARQLYWQATMQHVEILDPLVMMRVSSLPNPLPRVHVWVFGLDSNRRVVVFPEQYDLSKQLPGPVASPARPEVTQLARSLFTQDTAAAVSQEIDRGNRDQVTPGD
jgi:hypothetical protein